ncbi:Retrovirus-related Pol polyprotein from transposon 17.6 [Labeo rohita]|uniref:Gypsy retrotransposon integrase-like protein 1 n=1 Tax=Labeo rohita TaxID=84645 RepID=A0ABQ8L2J9_LABRO|nr:Retrovirus-related Pol polyprotein from transposon 17.6 [Labeo rohita]
MVSVPAPAPFLPCSGEPAIPFITWRKIFENYLLAINATGGSWSDARKRAVLLHSLGTEGQRLFYTLPDTGTTFEHAMNALEDYFMPKVNTVVARHRFRQCSQRADETIPQFLSALRELASSCAYADMESEMLRDQLVERSYAPAVRGRLLLEPSLTLDSAVTIACQVEQALSSFTLAAQSSVNAVASKSFRYRKKSTTRCDGAKSVADSTRRGNRTCYRCGAKNHLANATNCPAARAKCHTCGKIRHFSKVCRSSKDVREVVPDIVVLLTDAINSTVDKLFCDVRVTTSNGLSVETKLVVDTGSSVSILPEAVYKSHFSDCSLTVPKVKLVTYLKEDIAVLGCLHADVSLNDKVTPACLYIVKGSTALMGMDLIRALNCSFHFHTIPAPDDLHAVVGETIPAPNASVGCVKGFVHKPTVKSDATPVRQKLRRLPFAVRQAVSAELDSLLQKGIIEKIDSSPWISPIVVTAKKGGKIRLCVDLREPNKALIVDSHPLPHMEELLNDLRGASVFTTIDLMSAHHQLPLHEECRDITVFITHDGLFRYCRVPYGLASAPSAFQKMMETVLIGIHGVSNYLDDIIMYGATQDSHDATLRSVMQRLSDAGLELNWEKCTFSQSSLKFLGHVISKSGIFPDDEHMSAIIDAPALHDLASLRSFLGLISWYSKFLPNFASVAECALLRDTSNAEFDWTDSADCSFKALKELLSTSPVLALFDPSLPIIISTDASDYGLGGVLTQMHPDETEKTVAFASRTLTAAERKYSTVEKEALACIWAVEKWRPYLWGQHFTLRTDHRALTTLLATKGIGRAGMRVARWSARLLCYTYDVLYRPGSLNCAADCLSRLPLPTKSDGGLDPEMVAFVTGLPTLSVENFLSASESCPELVMLRSQISQGWPKTSRDLDPVLVSFFCIRDELCVDGVLVRRGENRAIVPSALRSQLVNLAHETHQGIVQTKWRLRDLFWWPQMDAQVQSAVSSCLTCQMNDKSAKTAPAPLQPVSLPPDPWQKLGIYIVGPFDSGPSDCLFSREGNPQCVVTDNGPQFVSSVFADFLKERGISHIRSSVYYPQGNAAVERWNRVLKECILSAEQMGKPWKHAVTEFLQSYSTQYYRCFSF